METGRIYHVAARLRPTRNTFGIGTTPIWYGGDVLMEPQNTPETPRSAAAAETVLVVEDDIANALLVEAILTRVGGFTVVRSEDGDEILEMVAAQRVAAVVMDVSLSRTAIRGRKVDGVELTREIRDLASGSGVPVVLLTAHAMRGDRERLLFASGATDYVAKPIGNQGEFVELVRSQIKGSGENPAARRREGGPG
jgi:CheY-like chemotaxis protein